jgi:hypothetical protein
MSILSGQFPFIRGEWPCVTTHARQWCQRESGWGCLARRVAGQSAAEAPFTLLAPCSGLAYPPPPATHAWGELRGASLEIPTSDRRGKRLGGSVIDARNTARPGYAQLLYFPVICNTHTRNVPTHTKSLNRCLPVLLFTRVDLSKGPNSYLVIKSREGGGGSEGY